jgi:hypothetical protein
MVTNVRNVALTVLVADCAVIGLYDPTLRAIGIAHAGWRGTLRGVAGKAVRKMKEAFGSDPADILAAVGPSIGPCCYEVGRDVIDGFHEVYPEMEPRFFANCKKDRAHLNLWEANRWQLIKAGVREENIELAEMCTSCRTDMFYSHRRERGGTGRFGGLIMLRDAPNG